MKTKFAKFNETYFDAGAPKYIAGQHYPITDETKRLIAAGTAEIIQVDLVAQDAQTLAELADLAEANAVSQQAKAAAALEEAKAARKTADDAAADVAAAAAKKTKSPG